MERPIILKAHEVRGILDGRQTQLRRIIKPPRWSLPEEIHAFKEAFTGKDVVTVPDDDGADFFIECPFGQVGDRLWVREAFGLMSYDHADESKTDVIYREDAWFLESDGRTRTDEPILNSDLDGGRWRPAQHMQRYDSRILLEIVSVRVERLQDISYDDAVEHGSKQKWTCLNPATGSYAHDNEPEDDFRDQWVRDNGVEGWNANPFVWCIEFRRVGE